MSRAPVVVVVAVCRVELVIPGAQSLKAKRMVLRSILDSVRARHHVSIAEVGHQDTWQRASLGFAVVSNDRGLVDALADQITRAIGGTRDCYIADRALEILSMGSRLDDLQTSALVERLGLDGPPTKDADEEEDT